PLVKSIEYFDEAARLDPGYAAAYAGISEAWEGLHRIGARSFEETIPPAKEAAAKALALDDTLAEAHTAMAVPIRFQEWNPKACDAEVKRAIELNPGSSDAHLYYSTALRFAGQADRSEEHTSELQ